MKAVCLASSSEGNCYAMTFEKGGRSTTILVECGLPLAEISRKLVENGISMMDVDACLITHYHGDHAKCAVAMENRGVPIFGTRETLYRIGVKEGEEMEFFDPKRISDIAAAVAFPVDHDAEGSSGFVIKALGECVLFINDCKGWDDDLSAIKPDYVFIECNYWEKQLYAELWDLRKKIAEGTGNLREASAKKALDERVSKTHMSLRGCIEGLRKIDLSKCRAIFLMHLSERNANEYRMKTDVEEATGVRTLVCKRKGGIK